MQVIDQSAPLAQPLPGIAHATWAGRAQGLAQLSVWRQSLAPGGATPPHSHDCDEVVLCLAGRGRLHDPTGGTPREFGPGQTVVLPRGGTHAIDNPGSEPLELIGIFGASPVGTFAPDGAALALPWDS